MRKSIVASCLSIAVPPALAPASDYLMLTGVDVGLYPGSARNVLPIPGPGFPGTFLDGDRLTGTADVGPPIVFQGIGTPLFPPNHVGALSFLFRRASVPIPPNNRVPLMGIDYLGGELLDLDGNLANGVRSLVPVVGATPVVMPGTASFVGLSFDFPAGTVTLDDFDATGTNEGGANIQAEIATTLVTPAGTTATGGRSGPVNPLFDTRIGTITPHVGPSGPVPGVWRIDGLQVELWYDSVDPNSGTAHVLGTIQHFATFRGWLIRRDCSTGAFPTLAGLGLGSTAWPAIDAAHVGQSFQTAHGLAGGSATIGDGVPGDVYSNSPNGVALAGGDLGAYLDAVVAPLIDSGSRAFVYLESVGFGINNSGDPVFADTNGYDVVVIARKRPVPPGDIDGDGDVDPADVALFVDVLIDPDAQPVEARDNADLNGDCRNDGEDVLPFVEAVL